MKLKQASLLIVSSLLFFIAVIFYFKRTVMLGDQYGATDFFRFYQATQFYFSGQDIYSNAIVKWDLPSGTLWLTANANLNLPFFSLLLLPLHIFNYANALLVWNSLAIILMALGVYLSVRPFPQWHKYTLPILALFTLYLPNAEALAWGQITALLLVVLAGAWLLARNNKDIAAGVLIGLACALKLFCGLFLIYFLCIKKYRLFFISLLTFGVTVIIGGVVFGFHSYVSYFLDLNKVGWYASTWNVSFYGFFMRLFSNADENIPLIHLSHLASVCTQLCSVILLTCLILKWQKWGNNQFDRGFALVMTSMLLLSPLGWLYYFPLLIIPYLVLISEENDNVHLALCFLLLLSTLMGHLVKAESLSQIFLAGGLGFYVLLGLVVLLVNDFSSCEKNKKIAEKYWIIIYGLIFLPSLISLGIAYRGLSL
jgi:hypothetical protein